MAINTLPYNPSLLEDIKTPLGGNVVSKSFTYSIGTFNDFNETYTFTGLKNEPFILSTSYNIPGGIDGAAPLTFEISVNGVIVFKETKTAVSGNPLYYNFTTGVIPTSAPTTVITNFLCNGAFFVSNAGNKASELVQIIQ